MGISGIERHNQEKEKGQGVQGETGVYNYHGIPDEATRNPVAVKKVKTGKNGNGIGGGRTKVKRQRDKQLPRNFGLPRNA